MLAEGEIFKQEALVNSLPTSRLKDLTKDLQGMLKESSKNWLEWYSQPAAKQILSHSSRDVSPAAWTAANANELAAAQLTFLLLISICRQQHTSKSHPTHLLHLQMLYWGHL